MQTETLLVGSTSCQSCLDGERQEISFNILAEHLLTQIDEEGNQYQIFKEIVDHRKDEKKAVDKADQYFKKGNRKHKRKTTTGWDLEVEWKDGSTSSSRVCKSQ